jgi:aspartyl aminopeptidase
MSESKKSEWREKLFYQQKNGYDLIDAEESRLAFAYCEGYKRYLNASRTEREAVREAIAIAEAEGFVPYVPGMALKAGDRVYHSNRGKALMLAVIGEKPLSEGCVIAGAHVDCPRLDLKQVPMYEDTEMAYFKTHYYGGIKKYQWVTIPLELHGVVALKNGDLVDVVIGRDPDDPQFVITDLLPHLAADQMKKTLAEGITGEGLNILIGSMPYDDEGKDVREEEIPAELLETAQQAREVMIEAAAEDDDALMASFRSYAQAFKSELERLEVHDATQPQYPGRGAVTSGKALMNEVLGMKYTSEFYSSIQRRKDEFADETLKVL